MNTPPAQLIIFGITGDLARKKLLPALEHLAQAKLLPEPFEIIGVTRRHIQPADLLEPTSALTPLLSVITLDMTDPADYHRLKATLDAGEAQHGVCMNRLIYLSIPPNTYAPVVELLGQAGLNAACPHGTGAARLMVEKPFGYDLISAQELIHQLTQTFAEDQIYRIDHYLAKETAQNILTFRFANPIFQAVWDRRSVRRVTITASETIGIEGRVAFYEPTGALRDLIQSHLLQLLALVTMEQPATMDAPHIHDAKLKLLKSIKPIPPNKVATQATRGQYQGYRDEVKNPDSTTETFARLNLAVDNDRWQGVPIVLQTGKRLDRKTTEITLEFGDAPTINILTLRIQPNEGIMIDLQAKKPGFDDQTQIVEMDFNYKNSFGPGTHPDAYERVLVDGLRGDQSLFATSAEVLASWAVIEPVLREWAKDDEGLITYESGANPIQIQHH